MTKLTPIKTDPLSDDEPAFVIEWFDPCSRDYKITAMQGADQITLSIPSRVVHAGRLREFVREQFAKLRRQRLPGGPR